MTVMFKNLLKSVILAGIISAGCSISEAQRADRPCGPTQSPGFNLFPDRLLVPPPRTNPEEARIGLVRFLDRAQMRVEIGNSIDLIEFIPNSGGLALRAGIDFFAYAFVRDHQGLYLQIDAIDGFFGGNISISELDPTDKLMGRLRIIHHSAHLADGNYWIHAYPREWSKPGGPIPFSRDFGEFLILHQLVRSYGQLRYYGGISYATLNRPAEYRKLAGMLGIEFTTSRFNIDLFNRKISPYVSWTGTMSGTPAYTLSHNAQMGLKVGEPDGKGVNLFVSYLHGKNPFGEYYDERLSSLGAGFSVDFF